MVLSFVCVFDLYSICKKSVRRIFNSVMKILLEVIRQLIAEASIVDFANKLSGKIGLLVDKDEELDFDGPPLFVLVALQEKNGKIISTGYIGASDEGDGFRINKMYAHDAKTAVFLLAAALESWKRVFTDFNVSPAASDVIQRYYNQNLNDETKIEKFADRDLAKSKSEDFLRAAYLGPVGFDLKASQYLALDMIAAISEQTGADKSEIIQNFVLGGSEEFNKVYADKSKTKTTFDDLLKRKMFEKLVESLIDEIADPKVKGAQKAAIAWINDHSAEMKKILLASDEMLQDDWKMIVRPYLQHF